MDYFPVGSHGTNPFNKVEREWVSIEKELPPFNLRVIIHFTYDGVYAKYSPAIGWLDKRGWHTNTNYEFPSDWKVTHWMLLPEEPA